MNLPTKFAAALFIICNLRKVSYRSTLSGFIRAYADKLTSLEMDPGFRRDNGLLGVTLAENAQIVSELILRAWKQPQQALAALLRFSPPTIRGKPSRLARTCHTYIQVL